MGLFREEVSEFRKARLHGEVVLSQSISTREMAGALFAIVAIVGTWVSLGTYARIETVPGILTTNIPSAKVIATQSGVVTELQTMRIAHRKSAGSDGRLFYSSSFFPLL